MKRIKSRGQATAYGALLLEHVLKFRIFVR